MRKGQGLLSVKELAAELGVSVDSVRRAFWNGGIPGFRLCKMLRFDLKQVRRAMRVKGLVAGLRAGAVQVGDSRPRGQHVPAKSPRVGNTGALIAGRFKRKAHG